MEHRKSRMGEISLNWRRLLYISLAFNVMAAGVALGAFLQPHGQPRPAFELMGAGPVTRVLTPEQRKVLVEHMRARDDIAPPRRDTMRQNTQTLAAALRAEPFMPQSLADIFEAQRANGAKMQNGVDAALLDFLSGLTAEERADLADRLEHSHERGPSPERR